MRLLVALVLLQLVTGRGLSGAKEWTKESMGDSDGTGEWESGDEVEMEPEHLEGVRGAGGASHEVTQRVQQDRPFCVRCHPHAICETRPDGSQRCLCKHGFIGNGITVCNDVDECLMDDTCANHELCQNSPGSFECRCRAGFTRRRGRCVGSQARIAMNASERLFDAFTTPADNPSASPRASLPTSGPAHENVTKAAPCATCNIDARCNATTGRCMCAEGYIGNGITICKDIDECLDDICDKTYECHNSPGSYKCNCPTGFHEKKDKCVVNKVKRHPCPAASVCGVTFPETSTNFAIVPCYPNSTGFANYSCHTANGNWSKKGPNFKGCTIEGPARPTWQRWTSEICGAMTEADDFMGHGDDATMEWAASLAAALLPREPPRDWAELPPAEAVHILSRGLAKIDKAIGVAAALLKRPGQVMRGQADGNELEVMSLHPGVSNLHFVSSGVEAGIYLSVNNTELTPGAAAVSFGYNPHVHSHLPPLPLVSAADAPPDSSPRGPRRIISAVLSATLLPSTARHVHLTGNVTFSLRLLENPEDGLVQCGFWVEHASTWSTLGCEVAFLNHSHAHCSCSHLTHFAILLAHRPVSEHDALILSVLTRVALSVSLVCLALSVATFMLSRALHGARNSVHANLCATLFIAEFIFLLGVHQTAYTVLCKVIAYFLHYFFLAAFTWMSLEGVCLYFMVVQVFKSRDLPVRSLYAVGYGVPLVILILTSAIAPGSHGTDKYCWLDKSIYWSFAGPVLCVITTNLGFLGITMYKMIRHRHPITPGVSCMETMRVLVLSSLALTFLLGVPWVFALFYVSDGTAFALYIFTVFAALQGLFIYIFHCLLQKKVRDEYVRIARRLCGYTELVRGSTSSSSGHGTRTRGSVGNGFGASFKFEETNQGFRSNGLQPSFTENGGGGHLKTFAKSGTD
ncbi:adhesion G protein-coupled receptor L4-like isoform X2 [Lampetra fluviatilis]